MDVSESSRSRDSGNRYRMKPSAETVVVRNLDEKLKIRGRIVEVAATLLGIKYRMRKLDETDWRIGKWTDQSKLPESLDCSGLVEGVFRNVGLKLPHGSQNQFNATMSVDVPRRGDLAFAAKDKDINKVDHVGIVYDDARIIEARAFQKGASFVTGEVILRPISKWMAWNKFVGFRSHEELT